jgi:hypothetical protein
MLSLIKLYDSVAILKYYNFVALLHSELIIKFNNEVNKILF